MIYRLDEFPMWMTWSVTMVYYVLTPLMGFAYFLYTVSIVYTERKELRKVIGFGVMPALVYGVLVLINPLTKNLFDISLVQGYVRGPWIVSTYLIFYAYCAASIVVTVLNKKRIDRNIYHILAAFPILAVLVILVQQMYPNVILSGSAATCALLIIYLHLQNKQISMDYLTNVPNRKELLNMLGLMIKKSPEKQFVLVVVSLRDFRQVNNTCGQQKGDEFLKNVCDFLYEIGPKNHVYRFSGDEFALLFTHSDETEIKKCITDIRQRMEKPWQIGDYRFLLSVVMGIIWHSGDGETLEEVINAVEYAVFRAKSGKSGEICYCDKEMLDGLERRRKVIMILKEKIADRSFEMYYQPIYSVADGEFCYAESLMRIPESPIGPIYPSEFIPIAEETGLIHMLMGTDGRKSKVLDCVGRTLGNCLTGFKPEMGFMKMDGKEVFKFAVRKVPEIVNQILDESGLAKDDIDYFVLHQANMRIIESAVKRLDIPMEKVPTNIERYANTSAASIPILLDEMKKDGKLHRGDKLILAGFGAGLTWGATLIEW